MSDIARPHKPQPLVCSTAIDSAVSQRNGFSRLADANSRFAAIEGKLVAANERPILIVEDDESLRQAITTMLEMDGYPVRSVSNGAEALEAIEEQAPSLVLLDMVMPVLDGREFAAALKARDIELPILVMSASHDPRKSAEEIRAAGAIAKPFDVQELLTKVDQFRAA